jgi:hypothetical protein
LPFASSYHLITILITKDGDLPTEDFHLISSCPCWAFTSAAFGTPRAVTFCAEHKKRITLRPQLQALHAMKNLHMKLMIIFVGIIFIVGCGSDNSETNEFESNDLLGNWVSNCAEFPESDLYAMETYVFIENTFTLESALFSDSSCEISSGNINSYIGEYTTGESLISSDGASVKRLSIVLSSPDWPANKEPVNSELVYRISGADLYFGFYNEGETPSILQGVFYIKQ